MGGGGGSFNTGGEAGTQREKQWDHGKRDGLCFLEQSEKV